MSEKPIVRISIVNSATRHGYMVRISREDPDGSIHVLNIDGEFEKLDPTQPIEERMNHSVEKF